MSTLIISYKTHDQPSVATSVFSRLKAELPQSKIIGVSTLLNSAIVSEVNAARALLIVIGHNWAQGDWLNNPQDDDTLAIQTALNNKNVSVIPILVDGATIPSDLSGSFATLRNLPNFQLSSFNTSAGSQEIVNAFQSASTPAISGFTSDNFGGQNSAQTAYQQPYQTPFQTPQPPSAVAPFQQQGYMTYTQPQSTTDPNLVLVVELVGGFFGFLGIGHMLAGEVGLGIMLLIGWWIYSAFVWVVVILTLGLAGCLFGPINIVAVIFSALMARNTVLRQQGKIR